jgi:hypothetical protein
MFKRIKEWLERNSVFVMSMAAILMMVAGVLMSTDKAHGETHGTIAGNEESCQSVAVAAAGFATYRQSGMTWEEAKPQIEEAVKNAKGKEESFVKDDQDAADVLKLAHSVWHTTNTDIQSIANIVYTKCMEGSRSIKNMT